MIPINFIKMLIKIIPAIVNFVIKMFKLFQLVFIENPLTILLPGILYTVSLLLSILIQIKVGDIYLSTYVLGFFAYLITNFIGIVATVFNIVERTFKILPMLILQFFDKGPSFYVNVLYPWVIACEERYDAWFKVPNYHNKNDTRRLLLFCRKPCPEGQIPGAVPFTCDRLPTEIPSRCPNAIIRHLENEDDAATPIRTVLLPNMDKISSKTESTLNEYYGTCNLKTNMYDSLAIGVCRRIAVDADTRLADGLNKRLAFLPKICYDQFCSRGRYEPFCSFLQSTDIGAYDMVERWWNKTRIAGLAFYGIHVVLFLLVIAYFYRNRQHRRGTSSS